MTNEKLDEIEARARACSGMGDVHAIVDEDVPALVAELRRLRGARLKELRAALDRSRSDTGSDRWDVADVMAVVKAWLAS